MYNQEDTKCSKLRESLVVSCPKELFDLVWKIHRNGSENEENSFFILSGIWLGFGEEEYIVQCEWLRLIMY